MLKKMDNSVRGNIFYYIIQEMVVSAVYEKTHSALIHHSFLAPHVFILQHSPFQDRQLYMTMNYGVLISRYRCNLERPIIAIAPATPPRVLCTAPTREQAPFASKHPLHPLLVSHQLTPQHCTCRKHTPLARPSGSSCDIIVRIDLVHFSWVMRHSPACDTSLLEYETVLLRCGSTMPTPSAQTTPIVNYDGLRMPAIETEQTVKRYDKPHRLHTLKYRLQVPRKVALPVLPHYPRQGVSA